MRVGAGADGDHARAALELVQEDAGLGARVALAVHRGDGHLVVLVHEGGQLLGSARDDHLGIGVLLQHGTDGVIRGLGAHLAVGGGSHFAGVEVEVGVLLGAD